MLSQKAVNILSTLTGSMLFKNPLSEIITMVLGEEGLKTDFTKVWNEKDL